MHKSIYVPIILFETSVVSFWQIWWEIMGDDCGELWMNYTIHYNSTVLHDLATIGYCLPL